MRNKQVESNPYIYTLSKLIRFLAMKYQFLIHNSVVFRAAAGAAVSYAKGTVSQKNEFQINSYVHSSRNHWKCKYIFHGLTSFLSCKDSADNKIPLQPYSEKENKRNSCTLFLKCTLKYPYTAPTNIRTLKYSPMCYKLSVFSIVELFLGSCL